MDENNKIRVLIVDDSITYRHILSKVLEKIPIAEPVGIAASGKIALFKIDKLKPDLVLLDVNMPEMDGVQTLFQIKKKNSDIDAIMISAFEMETAKATIESLEIGALDFISKPKAKDSNEGLEHLINHLRPLIELIHTKKVRLLAKNKKTPQLDKVRKAETKPKLIHPKEGIQWLLIGVSTGGPNALHKLLETVDVSLTCPILIVQHMPPLFTQSLAERLQKVTKLKVVEAKDGDVPKAGEVFIAPGGKHMEIKKGVQGYYLSINDNPPVNNCRPAVDVLFNSAAMNIKEKILSVIMTGMGRDGTEGVRKLKQHGALCLVQDESTSVVWGMPGSVYDANLADEVIPLGKIGQRINELVL